MTRINLVPPETLCDQHLLAEHRELTRIPNCLITGKLKFDYDDRPVKFTLGKGHIKFFTNKLMWLWNRYNNLHNECKRRGFNVQYHFRGEELVEAGFSLDDWTPTALDIVLSQDRIIAKLPIKARYTQYA